MKNKILKFELKKIILISILHNCSVILSNTFENNVVSFIPIKYFFAVQICKRIISLILIN